jgi:outer membrane protein
MIAAGIAILASAVATEPPAPPAPEEKPAAQPAVRARLTPAQLFDFAARAAAQGDTKTAEAALHALTGNPDRDIRNEARFRLAKLLSGPLKRKAEAAILLRHILDETPNAAPVRLELARLDAEMGHMGAAARELRAAQAIGLPPAVSRTVRFYQQALDAMRPIGGSIELAIAPDSNVNRATTASALNTVIGDFTLSRDARATSGIGGIARGQAFARLPLDPRFTLLARLSGSASLYRDPEFDDVIVAPQVGPEWAKGPDRISLSAGPGWRWYSGTPYTFSVSEAFDWQHRLGKRGQIRAGLSHAFVKNAFNTLETGVAWGGTLGLDRAFSARFGGGMMVNANRQGARDAGYATTGFGVSPYLFREVGHATLTATLSYGHLAADDRLSYLPDRRVDNAYGLSLAATLRQIRVGSLSPLIRLRLDRNQSTVQIYDYKRVAGEVGLASAF